MPPWVIHSLSSSVGSLSGLGTVKQTCFSPTSGPNPTSHVHARVVYQPIYILVISLVYTNNAKYNRLLPPCRPLSLLLRAQQTNYVSLDCSYTYIHLCTFTAPHTLCLDTKTRRSLSREESRARLVKRYATKITTKQADGRGPRWLAINYCARGRFFSVSCLIFRGLCDPDCETHTSPQPSPANLLNTHLA